MSKQQELPNMPPVFKKIEHLDGVRVVLFEEILRDTLRQGRTVTFSRHEHGVMCSQASSPDAKPFAWGSGDTLLKALDQANAQYATQTLYGAMKDG
jgi:hypothetical protein